MSSHLQNVFYNKVIQQKYKSFTTFIFFFPILDDMVENENETLRDRVSDLEKRVHDQNDEITCLRATLADALRRINSIESTKGTLSQKRTSVKTVCNYVESDLNEQNRGLDKSAM